MKGKTVNEAISELKEVLESKNIEKISILENRLSNIEDKHKKDKSNLVNEINKQYSIVDDAKRRYVECKIKLDKLSHFLLDNEILTYKELCELIGKE
jgi:hypothetical protein